jgi:hypothetical protein
MIYIELMLYQKGALVGTNRNIIFRFGELKILLLGRE